MFKTILLLITLCIFFNSCTKEKTRVSYTIGSYFTEGRSPKEPCYDQTITVQFVDEKGEIQTIESTQPVWTYEFKSKATPDDVIAGLTFISYGCTKNWVSIKIGDKVVSCDQCNYNGGISKPDGFYWDACTFIFERNVQLNLQPR